ncbi:uncharacterized protein [Oryctolagus cuniculus]|uniref:uncharacterized protein n=1 Tax=Oryctolagus cuniculus TaxID=9986 RepID=UPI00387A3A9C
MDSEGLGGGAGVALPRSPRRQSWGRGSCKTFPLTPTARADKVPSGSSRRRYRAATTRFTEQHTQSRFTTLLAEGSPGTGRSPGEGAVGSGERAGRRPHPVSPPPPRAGPGPRISTTADPRQPGAGAPGRRGAERRGSGRPRPRPAPSRRLALALAPALSRRPPPAQAGPRPLSEPAASPSAPGYRLRGRAGCAGPAPPATAPRKAAAAAAPPRAPAPRASPRPRRLAPVRARGPPLSRRQPVRLPDLQEGMQEEPTDRHPPPPPPQVTVKSPDSAILLARPPSSSSSSSEATLPNRRPPPAPPPLAPPRPPLHTLSPQPPRPTPPARARHSLGKKTRRSQGRRSHPIRARHWRLLPSLRPFPSLGSLRRLPPTGRRWLAQPSSKPPGG